MLHLEIKRPNCDDRNPNQSNPKRKRGAHVSIAQYWQASRVLAAFDAQCMPRWPLAGGWHAGTIKVELERWKAGEIPFPALGRLGRGRCTFTGAVGSRETTAATTPECQ
jgi:hypothetical protein